MKKQKDTFESLLLEFQYHFNIRTVFDDFLTMAICSFGRNPETGLSHDEDLYMQTIEKYKNHDLRHNFPKLMAAMTNEMEARRMEGDITDVLGNFYEKHLFKKGMAQFFTPWPVCILMASLQYENHWKSYGIRLLDPCCGSGRILLAHVQVHGIHHVYYGIDIDHTCVKMTALSLFMNGCFFGEIMWGDALSPDDFRMSYKLSWEPFGIFRVQDKELSHLWNLHRTSFNFRKVFTPGSLPSEDGTSCEDGEQMELF